MQMTILIINIASMPFEPVLRFRVSDYSRKGPSRTRCRDPVDGTYMWGALPIVGTYIYIYTEVYISICIYIYIHIHGRTGMYKHIQDLGVGCMQRNLWGGYMY